MPTSEKKQEETQGLTMNMSNVFNTVSQVPYGRCTDSIKRLNTTLRGFAKVAAPNSAKMGQVLAFIGNEVGCLKLVVSENANVDRCITTCTDTWFDAKVLGHLDRIELHNVGQYTRSALRRAGWRGSKRDKLRGIRIGFYPVTATPNQPTCDQVVAIQWNNYLMISDRKVSAVIKINSRNRVTVVSAVREMGKSQRCVGNGGLDSPITYSENMLRRVFGYLVTLDQNKGIVVAGLPVHTIMNRGCKGKVRNKCAPRFSTGAWQRPHLRRAHVRYTKRGPVYIKPVAIHTRPTQTFTITDAYAPPLMPVMERTGA